MQTRILFSSIVVFIFLSTAVFAQSSYTRLLSTQEIERVRTVKMLLKEVDTKSFQDTIRELERSRHPLINLEMKEAMASTYTDIVRTIGVEGQKKKEWLYSMICLNMAYLQFGGSQGKPGSTTELNRLIRQDLKKYLPTDVLHQPGFIYSLE